MLKYTYDYGCYNNYESKVLRRNDMLIRHHFLRAEDLNDFEDFCLNYENKIKIKFDFNNLFLLPERIEKKKLKEILFNKLLFNEKDSQLILNKFKNNLNRFLNKIDLIVVIFTLNQDYLLYTGEDIQLSYYLKYIKHKSPFIINNENNYAYMDELHDETSSTMNNVLPLFFRHLQIYKFQTYYINQNILPVNRKYCVVIIGRNDNFGGDNYKRTEICLNSWTKIVEMVYFVDLFSENQDIITYLNSQNKIDNINKIKTIIVKPDVWKKIKTENCEFIYQTLSRNIGIRNIDKLYNIVIQSNVDIIPPSRFDLDNIIINDNVIKIIPRKDHDINEIINNYNNNQDSIKKYKDYNISEFIESDNQFVFQNEFIDYSSYKIWNFNQVWEFMFISKIRNCGDFQITTRNSIFDIRGFEQSMDKTFCSDTNLQKKFWNTGREIIVESKKIDQSSLFCIHMSHSVRPSTSQTKWNNMEKYILDYHIKTENDENWGGFKFI